MKPILDTSPPTPLAHAAVSPGFDTWSPGSPALADLDAEIDAAFAGDGFIAAHTVPLPAEDQASRLRALIAGVPASRPSARAATPPASTSLCRAAPNTPLTVAIASGKGGVGKTNIAVNLAVLLARAGHKVTLLDADLGTANADVLCGLTPAARLDHVLTGNLPVHDGARRTLGDIVVNAPGGFRLIPGSAGIARMADLSPNERRTLFDALAELDGSTDVLLIDTAAGVGSLVTSFIDAADTCLVVSTPEPTSIADAYALIKCASATDAAFDAGRVPSSGRMSGQRAGLPRFQLVMNQCADGAEARRTGARVRAVCDRFLGLDLPLLGWVAQDVRLPEAVRARQPLVLRTPGSEAARNLSEIAAALGRQLGLPERLSPSPRSPGTVASALRRFFAGV